MATGRQYIIRLISSADHNIPKAKLLQIIKETGRDRYDEGRKQLFDDFYANHGVDFFGTAVSGDQLDAQIARLAQEFAQKTANDRSRAIVPDIAIVYDAKHCQMITDVYDDNTESDCYRFVGDPTDALHEVREI